jgi:hypothetical protein
VLRDEDELYDIGDEEEFSDEVLPAIDLIRELRSLRHKKLDKIAKMHREEPDIDPRARDIVSEIEEYLEGDQSSTRVSMYNRKSFAYPVPKIKVSPLIDEGFYEISKISGKYMPGLLPKHLIEGEKNNEELQKHLENIEALKKSLEETLKNYEQGHSELGNIISEYATELYGDEKEETGDLASSLDFKDINVKPRKYIDEMEELLNLNYNDLEEMDKERDD